MGFTFNTDNNGDVYQVPSLNDNWKSSVFQNSYDKYLTGTDGNKMDFNTITESASVPSSQEYLDAVSLDNSTGDSGYSLDGAMDWLGENSKGINTGIGLASLGMNAYSSFFGQGKETYDKNMTLLNQQIESNSRILDNDAAVKTAWANTEKSKGLAAAGTQNG